MTLFCYRKYIGTSSSLTDFQKFNGRSERYCRSFTHWLEVKCKSRGLCRSLISRIQTDYPEGFECAGASDLPYSRKLSRKHCYHVKVVFAPLTWSSSLQGECSTLTFILIPIDFIACVYYSWVSGEFSGWLLSGKNCLNLAKKCPFQTQTASCFSVILWQGWR